MTVSPSRVPWTLDEFREVAGGEVEDAVLRPMLNIYNTALKNGLTRNEVIQTVKEASKEHPGELPAGVLIGALQERINAIVKC
jgi:hypothetical protein